jgi:hypothetical protein
MNYTVELTEEYFKTQQRQEGDLSPYISTNSIQPGAANYARIQGIRDFEAILAAIDATIDDLDVRIAKCTLKFDVHSLTNFFFTPFLVTMEDGVAIPTTDNGYFNPLIGIRAALTGTKCKIVLGETIESKQFLDNGTVRYSGKGTFEIGQLLTDYLLEDYYPAQLLSLGPANLRLGIHVYEGTANTTINYDYKEILSSYFVDAIRRPR